MWTSLLLLQLLRYGFGTVSRFFIISSYGSIHLAVSLARCETHKWIITFGEVSNRNQADYDHYVTYRALDCFPLVQICTEL